MRFPHHFFSWKSTRMNAKRSVKTPSSRISRIEKLESRDLLSLSTTSADYRALVTSQSFGDSEENAIWVTSLTDVVNSRDGVITLREALEYAGQSLTAGNVSTTIRFAIGGVINLSSSAQSLKILSKSVTVDATDVGGVTIQAPGTLALYLLGGATSDPISVTLTNLTITGGVTSSVSNTPAKGSAIQTANYCNLTLNNCSIRNNTSTSALGVGVYVASGTLVLNDVVFSDNVTTGETSKGGAVYIDSGTLKATNVVFINNTAADGGAVFIRNGSALITNCSFNNNGAVNGNGGALSTSSEFKIVNTSFSNNSSSLAGGAIYVQGDAFSSLENVFFTNNTASSGGAIAQNGQQLTLTDVRFSLNEASGNGGAVYIENTATVIANKSTFSNNLAGQDGGAVFNAGSFYLSVGRLEENETQNNGGSICSVGYFEIRGTSFDNNHALNNGGSICLSGAQRSWLLGSTILRSTSKEGAGIFSNGLLTIADSTISNNESSTSGGGLSNAGDLVITNSKIEGNKATGLNAVGGGILNYVHATLNVSDSFFISNQTPEGSGGAVANSGSAEIEAVTVTNNSSDLFGGGILNSGMLDSRYSTFNGNHASDGGAVADVYGSSSNFISSTFWGNVATNNGGAFYSYGSTSFQNSTLSNNVAQTVQVAACYSPTGAVGPSFDSTTVVVSNFAADSIVDYPQNHEIVISDAQTGDILDRNLQLTSLPVNSNGCVKTLLLTNTGSTCIQLSNFQKLGNASNSTLSYSLYDSNDTLVDIESSFILAAGETVTLTISITPNVIGSQFFGFNWKTTEVTESGTIVADSEKTFTIESSVNISILASATSAVSSLGESSNFNISTNSDGSFNINLSKKPSSNVILYLSTSNDVTCLSTDVLLFTKDNYNVPQQVTVSLDKSKLNSSSKPSEIVIHPQLLTPDVNYKGTLFADITLKIADYIVLEDDCSVDINAIAPTGISRWDLNDDGVIDVITSGTEYWVDVSKVSGDIINYKRTKNGVTTTTEVGVVYNNSAPSAVAEISTFNAMPSVVRLALESNHASVSKWRVNWGDGSPYSEITRLSTNEEFAHAYATNGTYAISIELIDVNGVGSGIWTELPPHVVSGIETVDSIFENAAEFFNEDICGSVIDNIADEFFKEEK